MGKVWCEADDRLYWQDGSGVKHPILHSDYAIISIVTAGGAKTIDLQDLWHLVDEWDTDGQATISAADQANNRIVLGASRVYGIGIRTTSEVATNPASFAFDAFEISATTVGITDISNADPGVVTTDAPHNLTAGKYVKITGCTTMTKPNNRVFIVGTVADATHFELHDTQDANIDTTTWGNHDAGTGDIAEAMRSCAHTDHTYTNGEPESVSSPPMLHAGTLGNAVELYVTNETNANNITITSGCLVTDAK